MATRNRDDLGLSQSQPWYEPPLAGRLHLSTLVQQTLSLIAQHGGVQAQEAFSALCREGIDSDLFAEFLRSIARHDLIEQDARGTLLLWGRR